jgi:hypothetical protein
LHNRLNTYHLSPKKWQEEKNNIRKIIENNGYETKTLEDTSKREKPKLYKDKAVTQWAKFT